MMPTTNGTAGDGFDTVAQFGDGKIAMIVERGYEIGRLREFTKANNVEWGVAPLPQYKEDKNRTESVENFKFYLETEVPKIVEQMKNEQGDREEGDAMLNKMIDEEFAKLADVLSSEKKAREETEEAFLDMLRSIINKIKAELENEKKQRESTEEMLLSLLEETCNKLDVAAQH